MFNSSKHRELISSISSVQEAVEHVAHKEATRSTSMVKKLSDIDDHLVTLIGLLQEVKNSNQLTTQHTAGAIKGRPVLEFKNSNKFTHQRTAGAIKGRPLPDVGTLSQEEEEDLREDYESPEEPVYTHWYYYDVEDINDGSHSKYSRLSDIAADLGASDSAPHYAMVNGSLFLGQYRIKKVRVNTKVKISDNPRQDNDKASIEIV